MLLKTPVGPDLHRRNCGGQVSHAHQVVGGAGHGKNPIHSTDSAMPHLPHQRNRLQPAEALFDSLSLSLAEGVTCVPRGAAINRAAAAPFEVLRYMRRHPQIPALGYKSVRVESFVSAYRHRLRAGKFLQHHQRRVALRRPVGLEHFRVHDQTIAILHQQIPRVTQLRLLAFAFARQQRLGIGLRFMRFIRPPLAAKVHRGIARIVIRRRRRLTFLGLKTLRSCPGFQQRAVHRKMLVRGQTLGSALAPPLATKTLSPRRPPASGRGSW